MVVLADKGPGIVNRLGAGRHRVVNDGQRDGAGRAQRGSARRIAEREIHCFIAFGVSVSGDQDVEGLASFPGAKGECSGRERVVGALQGRRVLCLIVNCGCLTDISRSIDGNTGNAATLRDGIAGSVQKKS